MFIDTHCHLFYPNFNGEVDKIIQNAVDSGVDYIIVPATDIASSIQALEITKKYPFIYSAAGVHPHDTKGWDGSMLATIKEIAQSPKVVAIGEIGLDYYYDFSPKEDQIKAFKDQLNLAVELKLPVIIHNREADHDIMEIMRKYKGTGLRAQFHCFTASLLDARELIEMHHYISFTGNITYAKADSLRKVVKGIEPENILLETDSPFLTPVPFRGQRNEPANVKLVAKSIAEIHDLTIEDIARTTSMNAYKLFGIGKMPKLSFTYPIRKSLYVNVTNRCNADCVFCDRKGEAIISGYNLKMKKSEEPEAQIYITEIGDPKKYDSIVFCGYGEPTIRWDVVKEVAKYVKENGGSTRLNTDGHGSFINKHDITPELKGLIDVVSISLNSVDAAQYAKLMRVDESLHAEMIDFAKKAKNYSHVVMSIVGLNEVDAEVAKNFVINEIGVDFRLREHF
ncbi:MAG: TatD family hydrolase [bacterium]